MTRRARPEQQSTFVLTLRAEPGVDSIRALRWALKFLWRRAGDSQPRPLTNAERQRRYRERKRNERDENVTHDAPRNDENVTPDAHALLEEPGGVE
jgi:hypothetical protein